jgi:antitoxin FitA
LWLWDGAETQQPVRSGPIQGNAQTRDRAIEMAGLARDSRSHRRSDASMSQLFLLSVLAGCPHCWHYESMAIQINIRDVPEKVRDELAARAALQGKSMQEFLRAELERLAARPSIDAWLQQVRKRKRATQTRISSKQILENRNADRR